MCNDDWNTGLWRCPEKMSSLGGPTLKFLFLFFHQFLPLTQAVLIRRTKILQKARSLLDIKYYVPNYQTNQPIFLQPFPFFELSVYFIILVPVEWYLANLRLSSGPLSSYISVLENNLQCSKGPDSQAI